MTFLIINLFQDFGPTFFGFWGISADLKISPESFSSYISKHPMTFF